MPFGLSTLEGPSSVIQLKFSLLHSLDEPDLKKEVCIFYFVWNFKGTIEIEEEIERQ